MVFFCLHSKAGAYKQRILNTNCADRVIHEIVYPNTYTLYVFTQSSRIFAVFFYDYAIRKQKIMRNSHGYFVVQIVPADREICARFAGVQYNTVPFSCFDAPIPDSLLFARQTTTRKIRNQGVQSDTKQGRSYSDWLFISTWLHGGVQNAKRNAFSRLAAICIQDPLFISIRFSWSICCRQLPMTLGGSMRQRI